MFNLLMIKRFTPNQENSFDDLNTMNTQNQFYQVQVQVIQSPKEFKRTTNLCYGQRY